MALNSESEQKSNPVLRVDRDSDSDLQALFDSVLKPDSKRPLQVPLRMRQLPKSFWNPPSTGSKSPSVSHSRENSADSAFGSGPVPVAHSRAHSSPASLQQTYAAGNAQPQQQPPVHHHTKQRSYDVGSHLHEDGGPLPPGWEQARTPEGQIYYLNHISRTTTWEDPRKTLAAAAAAAQHASAEAASAAAAAPPPAAPPAAPVTSITPATKTSTSIVTTPDPLGPLPDGWEQASTAEGETYFINHAARTTSWFDPRIPQHLQRTPAAGVVLPGGWGAGAAAGVGGSAQLQQKLRLQSLQLERERLKQRQLEIRQQEIRQQQELMVRQPVVGVVGVAGVVGGAEVQLDPFLSGLSEHQRQESGDSGLGMGLSQQSYSMPHTPEDFLAAMDDRIDDRMDCTSEPPTPMEANDISLTDDDLVPSLQLSEEFTSDILDHVLYRN